MNKLTLKQNKLNLIFDGIISIVLGIMILLIGIGNTIDIYFGVLLILGAAGLLLLACIGVAKKLPLPLVPLVVGGVLLSCGIGLFCNWFSVAVIIQIAVLALLGASCGLALHGLWVLIRVNVVYGIGELAIGAIGILVVALYMNVPQFQQIFWYVVGGLTIAVGVFFFVAGLLKHE